MRYQIRNTRCEIKNALCRSAFSLTEAVTSLLILAFISSSVLVVINRSVVSAANSAMRMQAFEIVRENMERVLVSNSVQETFEYGYSYKYPEIQWQTTVESFSGPPSLTATKTSGWIRAICSAEYIDTAGEEQKIELVHWLTNLTNRQMEQVAEEKRKEEEMLDQMTEGQRAAYLEQRMEEALRETPPPEYEDPTGPGPEPGPPVDPPPTDEWDGYPRNPEEFQEFIRRLFEQLRG